MEEIIKTLLLEGIDEDTIHRVLDVIEEEYEVVCENAVDDYVARKQEEYENNARLQKHYKKTTDKKNYSKFKKQKKAFNNAQRELDYAEGDLISSEPSEYSFMTKAEQKENSKRAGKLYNNAVRNYAVQRGKLDEIKKGFTPELINAAKQGHEIGKKLHKANRFVQNRDKNEQRLNGK